ncbi:ABC transporter permease [Sediminivirga luteola]|uniref:Glycine/betaine ABC transporter permease n=1 Tax=Sediminivirga luteola TaxID=1774748 RepID=A0A8J2TV69_9MICO|nr:ABC transporter permease [Sediminivirga luteola]MCI2264665.1 ABC transporter permease [Sediminivirga luteola]GGA02649.1 glycine/betaine ABC transporter permease [Sediminivirga luteola]
MSGLVEFFADPANWSGSTGIPMRVWYHLMYSLIALGIALVIAVPLGIYVGHTGRGEASVAGIANSLRALPTLGLLIVVVMLAAPLFSSSLVFTAPAILVLVLLAVPPILTGTYTGIQSADRSAVDAARGMGYKPSQVLLHVQLPCALPLIISGIRGAMLQIVSTATVAAYVSLNGLGRYIIDGRANSDFGQMAAGAALVALVALALELAFLLIGRLVVSPGLRRSVRRTRMPGAVEPAA